MRERLSRTSGKGTLLADDRAFPVVLLGLSGALDEQLIDELFDWITRLVNESHAKKLRYTLIFDASRLDRPAPSLRGQMSRRVDQIPSVWKQLNVSVHVVLTSPVVRGALTALTWMANTKFAVTYDDTLERAVAGARADLEGAGLEVPPNAESLLLASSRRTTG